MSKRKYTLDDVRQTYKGKDAWWTVTLVDPVASRLILLTANYTNMTPNQISLLSFAIGMIAAYNFYLGSAVALLMGAVLYHISFTLDCMDGKIARLKGTGSMFGVLMDIMLDHIRVAICGVALTVGQFQRTGDHTYLYLAFLFLGVYFFRHYNALMIYKLRRQMRGRLKKAYKQRERETKIALRARWLNIEAWLDPGEVPSLEAINAQKAAPLADSPVLTTETNGVPIANRRKIDLQQAFKSKFSWYLKIRDALLARRIRMHLFSGIEFQMFVFIVAPIVGFLKAFIIGGAALLLLFELAIIYKLWLSMKDYSRELAKLGEPDI